MVRSSALAMIACALAVFHIGVTYRLKCTPYKYMKSMTRIYLKGTISSRPTGHGNGMLVLD